MDNTFQYPPELLSMLIDAVPILGRSKDDLLLFFQGAGVGEDLLAPHRSLLRTNNASFKKFLVARDLLTKLNELGDHALGQRREILKRVTDFQDFSVCWPDKQAAARGLVAQIREVVNVKDSFTRMNIERERERKARVAERDTHLAAEKNKREQIAAVKTKLFALFAEKDAHKRGKALEVVLNSLFAAYGVLVKEAFTVKGRCSEGVIEQLDGLIEIDGLLYLVELKWWNTPLGTGDVSPHIVRLYARGGQARGLFISYTDFTEPAIATCREGLAGGMVMVLSTLQEIVELLNREGDLKAWLKAKVTASIADKNPMFSVAG